MKARFLALAALVLGLASCQNDPDVVAPVGADEVTVQLAVSADELATRAGKDGAADTQAELNSAFGAIDYLQGNAGDYRQDWNDVDLRYVLEVYDAAASYDGAKPVKDRQVIIKDAYEPVVFDLRLVPNREYRFVVFADFVANGSAALSEKEQLLVNGIRHEIGATLADITVFNEAINDEVGDAYFAIEDIEITNSAAQNIVLRRPYGKIRVVATDLAELNTNIDPKSVVFTYNALNPDKFNAVTGAISGAYVKKEFNGEYIDKVRTNMASHIYNAGYDAEVATAVNGTTKRNSHITLVTDYILATDTQKAIQFTMTVNDATGKEIKTTVFNTDIPVQRNYLTTVIGNVLTTATEIKVTIDDNFAGEIKKNVVYVDSAIQLQTALDNFENGQTIIFANDIKGNVTAEQVEGENIIIDGNGFKYDGTISIDGNSRHTGTETITIQNINFETNDSLYFIEQNSTDGAVRYPHNVTIKDCSFKGAADKTVVGMRFRQGYNIVVENCVADGTTRASASNLHSLAQLYGCTGVRFEGISVNASEGGVSFGTSTNCVIKDATIVAGDYGVRADASVETTLDIEDVNIEATVPFIARYFTGNYTINFLGENELEAPGYQVVLTNGKDDAAFVAPTGTYTLTGADNFRVFPGDKLYAYNQASLQYLLNNAADGDIIEFAADIKGGVDVPELANATITIDGRYYNYDGSFTIVGGTNYNGATTVFKNINFVTSDNADWFGDAFIYCNEQNGNTRYPDNVTITGCSFTANDAAVDVTVGAKFRSLKGNVTIEDCAGNGLHSLVQLTSCSTANVSIDRAGVVNCKSGISVGDAQATIKNTNIDAREYGIRANGTVEYALNLENVTITAQKPVIARKVSKNYAINFTGANTLNTTGYQVIFTTGDDAATFAAPAAYTLTGADGFKVFPRDADLNNYVYTADELKEAIKAGHDGETILLQGGVFEGTFKPASKNLTIKSADANNKATIKGRVNIDGYADGIKFEDIKFDINDDSKVKNSFTGTNYKYPATVVIYASATNFEGCEFKADIASGVCGINYAAHASGKLLKVNNCKFNGDFYAVRSRTHFEITNSEFNIFYSEGTLAAVWTWGNGNSWTDKVVFTGNTNVTTSKVYSVQLTSSTFNYCDINFNVQGNTNFYELKDSVNSALDFTGKTFESGSETF
ncbi:MAG: hypothetical protein IJD53_03430 [Alistipes sp.]|nr:hypothetical protein [Alistipes sp.]